MLLRVDRAIGRFRRFALSAPAKQNAQNTGKRG
jgi:hypothetical protein